MMTTERGYVHSIDFQTIAREGQDPRDLASLRVVVDRSFRDGENEDGSVRYNHDRDFWITVEMWGRRSKGLQGVVGKGARILMTGRFDQHTWTDRESGEERRRMVFSASGIAIDPGSVDSIIYKRKESSAPSESDD